MMVISVLLALWGGRGYPVDTRIPAQKVDDGLGEISVVSDPQTYGRVKNTCILLVIKLG